MSNISKQPVKIEDGVTITVNSGKILVNGPKGQLETKVPHGIEVLIENGEAKVKKVTDSLDYEKFAGLTRALIANMVQGVTKGFTKKLELSGVGYRAKVEGQDLVLNIGYAHPVRVKPLEGVTITVEENNVIAVAGINKQYVGDTASEIRKVRPPDPYKAKGIKYEGEIVRRKVGKAAKAVGGK